MVASDKLPVGSSPPKHLPGNEAEKCGDRYQRGHCEYDEGYQALLERLWHWIERVRIRKVALRKRCSGIHFDV